MRPARGGDQSMNPADEMVDALGEDGDVRLHRLLRRCA